MLELKSKKLRAKLLFSKYIQSFLSFYMMADWSENVFIASVSTVSTAENNKTESYLMCTKADRGGQVANVFKML